MSGRSVLLWVVLPFLVLCALALWLTRPEPVPPPRSEEAAPPPEAPRGVDLVTPPAPGSDPPVVPPPAFPTRRGAPPLVRPEAATPPPLAERRAAEENAVAASASTHPVAQEDVRTVLRAVRPLLDRCFEDVSDRNPGEQRATLRFTLEAREDGERLRNGEVTGVSVQDPMLQACLEDSLLDAPIPPLRSGETFTLTWPYHYWPPTQPDGAISPSGGGHSDTTGNALPARAPPGR